MDYKYIEQLLERYWKCDTSAEEEQILRTFFSQKDVPAELLKYRDLFASQAAMLAEETLNDDFDAKILSMIDDEPVAVKARVIKMQRRLMPLFKAAAVVAIIITLGNAAQLSINKDRPSTDEINYAGYTDTFSDPTAAYNNVQEALELVSEGISMAQLPDTTAASKPGADTTQPDR